MTTGKTANCFSAIRCYFIFLEVPRNVSRGRETRTKRGRTDEGGLKEETNEAGRREEERIGPSILGASVTRCLTREE